MSENVNNYIRRILGAEGSPDVQVSEIGLQTALNAGLSAFSLALQRRFGDGATTEEVQQFIADVRGVWLKPEGLNPVLAERVLLDALGEDGLVDDVPLGELTRVQNLLTYAMVNDLGITGEALEQFLLDAIEQLSELDNED